MIRACLIIVLLSGLSAVRLAVPATQASTDAAAGAVPQEPKLPVKAAPTKRSRDVNLLPPLPTLGRALRDRVGFEDPTTEYSNAVITGPSVKPPFAPAPFVKVGVPDPFELGDQLRPTIESAVEPGLTPVTVSPRRVK
jgi:hypothetical protein